MSQNCIKYVAVFKYQSIRGLNSFMKGLRGGKLIGSGILANRVENENYRSK